MEAGDTLDLLRDMRVTLESIRRILEIQARPVLLEEINSLASTTERRKMWILSNADLKTPELAAKSGLKLRAAQYFVEEGTRAGLLTLVNRSYPRRAIDLVPEEWREIKELEAKGPPPSDSTEKTEASPGNSGGMPDGQQ